MRRAAVLALAASAACSSGSPVIPANLRGPVAVVAFHAVNPGDPTGALIPLVAVASFRGNEMRVIDPATDQPVAAPNLAWSLGVPTLPRPTVLAAGSLADAKSDLLVVASNEPRFQVVGTWLDGSTGYGVTSTIDLSGYVGAAAQIVGAQVLPVASGPATGSPPVAPPTPGQAWLVVALADPGGATGGQLCVVPFARRASDGSIQVSGAPVVKPLGFSPNGIAASPDNLHLYLSTLDAIHDSAGSVAHGVAEVDTSGGLSATWPIRALDARDSPTIFVAATYVAERVQANFYTYAAPQLRVYAGLDPSGCGPERRISCGIATFDPARGGLAADPAVAGPPGWPVPAQPYRTPIFVPALPLAMGIAPPAAVPASAPPSAPYGSQVCQAPGTSGNPMPLCPNVPEEVVSPPFNEFGYPNNFMLLAAPIGQIWTSVTALATTADGLAYVVDLGRFGVVPASNMLSIDTERTRPYGGQTVGPNGPFGGTALFGFPDGTAAIGFWLDRSSGGGTSLVVSDSTNLANATTVWPGFTRDEHWLVSYQGVLPGFLQRRAVIGLTAANDLYIAFQESASQDVGVMPASAYWVTGAFVAAPELGVHTVEANGLPGDIPQFLLDQDPCPSTRPNWIPAGQTTPVYDPAKPPMAHETVAQGLLPPDPLLYPGGAIRMSPAANATLASEYACLVSWFTDPAHPDRRALVLTAFVNNTSANDYARGGWLRAGGFLLAGSLSGYAGRPELDLPYQFAWADESGVAGEALSLARKARRFYYPASFPVKRYSWYPLMTNPLEPGPVVGFRLGRFCPTAVTVTGCDPKTSPPARDAGVDFWTASGLVGMSRYPPSTSGGNYVTSFDKSTIPGQEYRGRVFYSSFVGDALMMIPPGLDVGQSIIIR